ncbi:MAG: hypothetical protein IC227_06365 [Enterococcus lacertideformus]|uniref:Uncharacterized protein n=1 Tax=Enterococcus lacertideformus TaxID=2771493 RepID=A0A931FBV8_9ENTE|nr:hypothetical protein [Enterococcus lacertideformus]
MSKKCKNNYKYFLDDFEEYPKKYFVRLFLIFFVSLLVTVTMFVFPQRIREEEVASLVYTTIDSPKLQPLTIGEAQKIIKESKAISVLFTVPKGEKYQELMKLFHNVRKMDELNRPIYFYPLIYHVNELAKEYNLAKNQMTIIFFKEGKEANRLTIEENKQYNFSDELIPEINRLPLTNIQKLENELVMENTQDIE